MTSFPTGTDGGGAESSPAAAPHIVLGGRTIGAGQPPYLIAEMSANHGQDLDQAVRLVRAMKIAGADAVKVQTYTADTLTIDCDNPHFRVGEGSLWEGRTLYDLYREAHTPWEWQARLRDVAHGEGLDFFSTPFDPTSVDFLESLDVPAYKIASFEIVDLGLIRYVAQTGKPLIISTGMATLEEVGEAVEAARDSGATQIVLLKCTSAYPAPPEEMNLQAIPQLARAFGTPVGLSDHTLALAVPVAAVALGASVIEKHFTLSRAQPGPDSAFSLEPEEFRAMADAARTAAAALGTASFGVGAEEEKSRVFRRSLFVVRDIAAGETFTAENVRSIRPGFGLAPKHLASVLGRRCSRDVARGTPLDWSLVADS
ncbi:MAG TPA: pseudaminic acid synthase [Gemmatimonadales bacterium]|nr:pseudaminic acid synthase [Gemmatimonadales bacterium]